MSHNRSNMDTSENKENEYKIITLSAILVISGIILSGPPMVFLIEYLRPNPEWINIEMFVDNYHWSYAIPYWSGFILMSGNILFVSSTIRLPEIQNRIHAPLAMICLAIYGGLVSLNYSIQTIYVPAAIHKPNNVIEALTMANPTSVGWTLEMFAYAFLGVAYWLLSIAFSGYGVGRAIKSLLIFNGIISIAGVIIPAINPELLLSSEGILGYVFWNILIVIIMILVIIYVKYTKYELSSIQIKKYG
ncbi:hypothetical protein ACFLU5_01315 [Bacteroidota bacterium]